MRHVHVRILSAFAIVVGAACSSSHLAAAEVPPPGSDLPHAASDHGPRTAVLAMGCFWCSEGIFEQVAGVTDVTSGYAGGTAEQPLAKAGLVEIGESGRSGSVLRSEGFLADDRSGGHSIDIVLCGGDRDGEQQQCAMLHGGVGMRNVETSTARRV